MRVMILMPQHDEYYARRNKRRQNGGNTREGDDENEAIQTLTALFRDRSVKLNN